MALTTISTDSDKLEAPQMSQSDKILIDLANAKKNSDLNNFNSNKTSIATANQVLSPIGSASVLTGGARLPIQVTNFSKTPLYSPKPENSRLSRVNTIQYSYALNGVFDFNKAIEARAALDTLPPLTITDFDVPLYLTIVEFNFMNADFDNFVNGVGYRKDKYIVVNSFEIGTLKHIYEPIGGIGVFKIENFNGGDSIAGNVDWSNPIASRPAVGDGGDVIFYDFVNTSQTAITQSQYDKIINGELNNLCCAISADMTGQPADNQTYLEYMGSNFGALSIFGTVFFELFGLATSVSKTDG